MKKNLFTTGKKAFAVLSAVGVTATLLSPFALNTTIFANEKTPQIASRTPGDARNTEIDTNNIYGQYYIEVSRNEYLSFFAMNQDKSILLNELTRIYNSRNQAELNFDITIPAGFSLNASNEIDAKLIDIFSKLGAADCIGQFIIYSGKGSGASYSGASYSIPNKAIDYTNVKNTISFPYIESLLVTNTHLKDLVITGSTNMLFDINLLSNYLPASEIYIHLNGILGWDGEKAVYYLPNYDITKVTPQRNFWNPPSKFYQVNGEPYILDDMNCLYLTTDPEHSIGFISDTKIPLYDHGYYTGRAVYIFSEYSINDAQQIDDEQNIARRSYGKYQPIVYAFKQDENKSVIKKDVFEIAKKYEVALSAVELYGETSKANYKLTFNTINTPLDFNPNLTYSVKDNQGVPQFQFDFEHSGALPGTMTVSAYVGTEYNKDTVYLYYINKNNKLEKQEVKATVEGGYIHFQIDHCSSYLVSFEQVDENNNLLKPSTPQDQNSNTGNVENTDTNTNVDVDTNKPETNTTTPSTNTTTQDTTKEDTKVNLTDTISPSTGDTTKTTVLLSTMAIATVALIGMVVYRKKNIKA